MRKVRIFLINAAILTATSLILRTVDVSFNVYISNKIGAEGMGIFQLVMSIYIFAITLAISGVGLTSTRLVAEELAIKCELGARTAMRRCIIYAAFFGTLSGVLLFTNARYIAINYLHNELTMKSLYVLSFSLPFMAISSAINGYFTAVSRVVKSASAQILEQFIGITITVYVLNFFAPKGLEYACLAVVLGGVIAEFTTFLYLYTLYLFDRKRYKNTASGSHITRRLLGISLPVAFSSYIRSGLSTIKHLLIPVKLQQSGLSKSSALSQYGILHGMVMPVIMFPSAFISAFSSLLVPEIARCNIQNDYNRINYIISRIFKITLLFSICVTGILFCYSYELSMAIYKKPEVSMFIRALSPLITIMYLDSIVDGMLKGLNEQVSVVQINIIDTIVCIGLIYFMLPIYSVKGYITVIFISEILNGYLSINRLFKATYFEMKFFQWIIKPLFAISIAAIFIRQIAFANVVVSIITTVAAYLVTLFLIGCINKEDFHI